MPELIQNELRAWLQRLPGQILLALVNATVVLVIVAALLTIVALGRLENFAENITATMTSAVIAQVGVSPQQARAKIDGLREDVQSFVQAIEAARADNGTKLDGELTKLKAQLSDLKASIDGLTNAKTLLTEETISQLGPVISNIVKEAKGCATN